eukprot:2031717-Pyramimonas_sp.AAC.1
MSMPAQYSWPSTVELGAASACACLQRATTHGMSASWRANSEPMMSSTAALPQKSTRATPRAGWR